MEQELMSEQSDDEEGQITDNDSDSQHEQGRAPCDTNYG